MTGPRLMDHLEKRLRALRPLGPSPELRGRVPGGGESGAARDVAPAALGVLGAPLGMGRRFRSDCSRGSVVAASVRGDPVGKHERGRSPHDGRGSRDT